MAKYKVIKYFTDLQDNDFAYNTGDTFPREGLNVKPSRIAELAGSDNRRGEPLIELVKDDKAVEETEDTPETKEKAEKPAPKRGRKPKAE